MVRRKTTKELIGDSFMELMNERSIRDVTVGDIAANCGVSARTFYNHFQDKFELIEYCYEGILRNNAMECWGNYLQVLRNSSVVVAEIADYCINSTVHVDGTGDPVARLANTATKVYCELIEANQGPEALTDDALYELYYYNYIILRAYLDWAKDPSSLDADVLASRGHALMPAGLEPLLDFRA